MTFLLISTCENKLSELEFVLPISRLIPSSNYKILHYAIILLGQKLKEEDEFREYQHQLQLDSD